MTLRSESLLNPADTPERSREKLLKIVDVLMQQAEQRSAEHGVAYGQFQRAALLEEEVRQRTTDLEHTLDLLSVSNARLADANRELAAARRNLTNAIETIQEGFALFDRDDVLVMYNSRFASFLPDVRAELRAGITFSDYVEMVSRSAYLDLTDKDNSDAWASRRRLRHRDSHVVFNVHVTGNRWIQIAEHRTMDDGTVILQTDVTHIVLSEREAMTKVLDDQASMIRATLEHITLGVCIFNSENKLAGVNQRLSYLLGLPISHFRLGRDFQDLFRQVSDEMESISGLKGGGLLNWVAGSSPRSPIRFEVVRRNRLVLVISAEDLPDGGFVMSVADVTAERRTMEDITRANETLEARVKQRTLDLEDALGRAERAKSARSRFVAAASHDLLQPLSAAKLFVASAEDEAPDDNARVVLTKAQNALASVENILSALLDISKLEAGHSSMSIMPVPLSHLLRQLRDEFAPMAAAKGIDLAVVGSSMVVESDATYLRRILQNLLSNAIRYTESGRVLVGVRRKPNDRLRVEVWDTGPGIAPKDQQSIFKEFHRLGVSASASAGMGLGLAIVDRACAQLGHPIHLDSEVGHGTRFGIDLPVSRIWGSNGSVPGAGLDRVPLPSEAGQVALLIENDAELRPAMVHMLERKGVQVIDVECGEEALDLMEVLDITPDLLLVDYQLGEGMDGLETLQALFDRFGRLPARLVTANRSQEVARAAKSVGVQICYKPINPREIELFLSDPS